MEIKLPLSGVVTVDSWLHQLPPEAYLRRQGGGNHPERQSDGVGGRRRLGEAPNGLKCRRTVLRFLLYDSSAVKLCEEIRTRLRK